MGKYSEHLVVPETFNPLPIYGLNLLNKYLRTSNYSSLVQSVTPWTIFHWHASPLFVLYGEGKNAFFLKWPILKYMYFYFISV